MRPYDDPMTGAKPEAAQWLLLAGVAPRLLLQQSLCASQVSSLCLRSLSVLNNMPTTALLDDFGKNAVE